MSSRCMLVGWKSQGTREESLLIPFDISRKLMLIPQKMMADICSIYSGIWIMAPFFHLPLPSFCRAIFGQT